MVGLNGEVVSFIQPLVIQEFIVNFYLVNEIGRIEHISL
jgi:hypothetical protein